MNIPYDSQSNEWPNNLFDHYSPKTRAYSIKKDLKIHILLFIDFHSCGYENIFTLYNHLNTQTRKSFPVELCRIFSKRKYNNLYKSHINLSILRDKMIQNKFGTLISIKPRTKRGPFMKLCVVLTPCFKDN